MANSDQNNPDQYLNYLKVFEKELIEISLHMRVLANQLVPQTIEHLEKIELNTNTMAAYSGSGASRALGATDNLPTKPGASTKGPEIVAQPSSSSEGEKKREKTPLERALYNPQGGKNASVGGGGWLGRVSENQGFRLPQFGQLTVQDTLEYVSSMLAGQANKKRSALQSQLEDAVDSGDIKKANELTDRLNSDEGGGGAWSNRSNTFHQMASGYATGRVVSTLAKQAASPFINARNLAYMTGYTGPSGQSFMGLFNPFGGASAYGLGQEASQTGFALNNNLSPGQAHAIYSNLFSQGWYGGSSTNAMRQGLASLTQANPLLGTDPQVSQMMDQATRMGQTSINTFVDTMKQIPQAANAAHVSLQQMISDSQALGDLFKGMGGNVNSGYQAANAWTSTTGAPASMMGTMLQNPMVQGQIFMQSGLMPFEQGLAPFGSQMGGILNSLNLFKNVAHFNPITQKDSIGLTNTVSSNDQTAALMSHYFGISAASAKNLLGNEKGIVAGTTAWQNSTDYQNRVMGALRNGNLTGNSGALTQLNGPAWQALDKQLGQARNSNGHLMFNKSSLWNINHAGDASLVKAATKEFGGHSGLLDRLGVHAPVQGRGGGDPTGSKLTEHLASLIEQNKSIKLPNSVIGTIAKDRTAAIKKAVGQNTQNTNQGPQITVALTPQAAKALKLQSHVGSAKAAAGAGGSSVNIPYGGGPSDVPQPNTETAGSTYGSSGAVYNSDF